ncbi:MAG: hypothetical protein MRK01_01085 [Candidatus Scalindua sp.]|nr:hypothetical protein [Candidatus Scalindua sp.]
MKILVIGAGTAGGYLGGLLARGGEDVTFDARGDYLASINASGLRRSYRVMGNTPLLLRKINNYRRIGQEGIRQESDDF